MPRNCSQSYFSLIEILIVVSILALLAGIAASFLGSGLGIIREEELKEQIVDLSQSARLTAQLQGAKQSITFSKSDSEQWQITLVTAQETTEFTISEEQKKQALQAWDPNAFNEEKLIALNKDWIILDSSQSTTIEEQNFHFYPDGQSSGGIIYLQTGENGRVFELSVDRLTSRVKWEEQK